MKLKRCDLKTRMKDNLTTIVWKERWNVNILMYMHSPSLEGNSCDGHGKAVKLVIIQDYSRHMGYVDKSDHMMNSYAISRWTWEWIKKIFFHLLDLTILNSTIILASFGLKLSHWQFKLPLVRDLTQEGRKGASISDHKTKKTSPIHESTKKTWLKAQQTLVYAV